MPPATFPPTPAPSTDIKGRTADTLPKDDLQFQLPPSAVTSQEVLHSKPVSPYPLVSPASSKDSRRSSSGTAPSDFSLPPPSSRSRKSIQIDAYGQEDQKGDDAAYVPPSKATKASRPTKGAGKKSTGTVSTAAGRKVARKTAHSIIERRRRSKMNEEFGVLKDLIPSCRGLEMHKLAILQASIDYMRYLETCIGDLKAGRGQSSEAPSPRHVSDEEFIEEAAASDEDMEMEENATSTRGPASTALATYEFARRPSFSNRNSGNSAELSPRNIDQRHRPSTSSTAASSMTAPLPYFGPVTSGSSVYSYSTHGFSRTNSATTTPVFGPYHGNAASHRERHSSTGWPGFQAFNGSDGSPNHVARERTASSANPYNRSGSTQTSPVIVPKDQGLNEAEASTALLMLNKDRRHSSQNQRRGLSVKDLLGS